MPCCRWATTHASLRYLRDAEKLAEALDDPYRLGWISAHLTHYFWSMRHLDRALAYGQRAVALAAPFDDIGLYAHAHFDLAEVHYSLGQYRQTIVAFEQLVARFTGDRLYERIGAAVFSVVSRRWLVQALAETGAFAAGIARGEEGIRIAETADHPYSLANICSGVGYLYVCKGDFQQAIPFHARSLELCRVWNLRQNVASFALHFGSCAGPVRTGQRIPGSAGAERRDGRADTCDWSLFAECLQVERSLLAEPAGMRRRRHWR